MNAILSRRRFLCISAAAAGVALMPGALSSSPARAAGTAAPHMWRGAALGADAQIQLHHPDAAQADRLIRLCLEEVARLEKVFSLYRADSALLRLNRDGELRDPPGDLVRLLEEAVAWGRRSEGAFDVTVQPLWQLHAGHFARPGADPAGPPAVAVEAARRLVDYRALQVSAERIAFARRGMAVTLNGIAQGYVTDRVAERLRAEGMTRVLVDLGEIRALDGHPDGRPWTVGLEDPLRGGPGATLSVENRAVATSGGYGTRFDAAGRFTHLFDPASGRSATRWAAVTVAAPDATTADALSTALSILPEERAAGLLRGLPEAGAHIGAHIGARLTRPDGTVLTLGSLVS